MDFTGSPKGAISPTDAPYDNIATDTTHVQLSSIFDLLDLEGNGDLDFIEFKVGLTSIGVNLTQDEAITLFESIDAENDKYVNKEMFIEWLSKPFTSQQMETIRNKLQTALAAAQEINNPIQDMIDEDEIANLLGNKAEYIHEIEDIKNDNAPVLVDSQGSNDTTKINSSEDEQSDSLDSTERRAIAKAKKKQIRRNSKKFANNTDPNANKDMETSLIEQQMSEMMQQQKYALDREVSGRNIYKEENASKWEKDEIDHEFKAMASMHRRLSQASLSIDQVQSEANKHISEFRKMSNTDNIPPNHAKKESLSDMSHNADTVGVPSKFDNDFDIMIDSNVEPTLNNKNVLQKIDTRLSSPGNGIGNAHGSNNASPRPIQEITTNATPHTTGSQAVMIGSNGTSQNNSRRNSLSQSYSMHSVSQSYNNQAAYSVHSSQQNMHSNMTDISQYTQPIMQQNLISNNGNHIMNNQNSVLANTDKNMIIRVFVWYLSPMQTKESLHRLWFHGANAVLSMVICFVMLALLALSIIFIPFCGIGLIFVYFQCLLSRHFAVIDSTFLRYFFGNKLINRFSIFIPKSHSQSIIGALKEYILDPHIIGVILYFSFIKLPTSFILSGITMVIFSGVSSVLLCPLIYWLDKPYFDQNRYCIFGTYDEITQDCNGWPINSFGETFLAFLVFIPTLPLTLHLSNFTAQLLIRITLNFLSINSEASPKQHSQNMNLNLSPSEPQNHVQNHQNNVAYR